MEPAGRVCIDCGVLKPFKDLVKNARSSYGCEKLCKDCHLIRYKPQWKRREKGRTERRRAEKKIKDELRDETIQAEIDYYARKTAIMAKQGLSLHDNAGKCDLILGEQNV